MKWTNTIKYGHVTLRELKGIEKCKGAPIMEGFPGYRSALCC